MTETDRPRPLAVIGGGFSGFVVARQLLRALPDDRRVLLCERTHEAGRGLAYSTSNPDHLLNLRAAQMSADPDRPGDFQDWLQRSAFDSTERSGIRVTDAGTFAARGLYGRYLAEHVARTEAGAGTRLEHARNSIVDVVPERDGFALRTGTGARIPVAGIVLAMGNLAGPVAARSRHRRDPWEPKGFGQLDPARDVLVVGTGLTMMDSVAALRRHGFAGRIVAVSRRGLVPKPHAPVPAWPRPDLSAETRASLRRLLAWGRAEIAAARAVGVDWRSVIDALRPMTDALWAGLPRAEQARFLRHLRPYWDVHRHRTAPPAADAIAEEVARGTLVVLAGRIRSVIDETSHAVVTLQPRGGTGTLRIDAQTILDATGFSRLAETEDPLVRNLLARGLVRPGPFGLGLDATPDGAVVSPRGEAPLWAIGPMLRGVLWECIAVPDIRDASVPLADAIAARLADV
ncbi:FAD/NAD(P)-binding protein [Methylobacterium sp. J-068]|uniref:FAD/NAD(P)-binding protein n=1 Tax=Methylobacterium sp. J-068 TaxID=2836649 RepID=UPI001FBBA87A|nr:FAD/NAD(P)-binding protein [Methylobacterium sp. J-068]MCJ2037282.1 FAD/NAD(P)-binding protein [Methylobacterium sp. J-068]